jgi:hypothetical protein
MRIPVHRLNAITTDPHAGLMGMLPLPDLEGMRLQRLIREQAGYSTVFMAVDCIGQMGMG